MRSALEDLVDAGDDAVPHLGRDLGGVERGHEPLQHRVQGVVLGRAVGPVGVLDDERVVVGRAAVVDLARGGEERRLLAGELRRLERLHPIADAAGEVARGRDLDQVGVPALVAGPRRGLHLLQGVLRLGVDHPARRDPLAQRHEVDALELLEVAQVVEPLHERPVRELGLLLVPLHAGTGAEDHGGRAVLLEHEHGRGQAPELAGLGVAPDVLLPAFGLEEHAVHQHGGLVGLVVVHCRCPP